MPSPIFYTCIIAWGIIVALYYYYVWRIEFVHKFIMLEPKWSNRLNNPRENEEKVLETENRELIKDYYALLRIRQLCIAAFFLSFPLCIYSLFF